MSLGRYHPRGHGDSDLPEIPWLKRPKKHSDGYLVGKVADKSPYQRRGDIGQI